VSDRQNRPGGLEPSENPFSDRTEGDKYVAETIRSEEGGVGGHIDRGGVDR